MMVGGVLEDDGTAIYNHADPGTRRRRVYLTDRYGDPAPILAEMRKRTAPNARLPWASVRNRDRAAAAGELDKPLPDRTLQALLRHIDTTPYLAGNGFGLLIMILDEDGSEGRFAGSDSVREPCWPHHLADLQRELADGLTPIPYASRKDRDEQAARIRDADPPMPDADALIAHVAATPYKAP